MLLEPTSFSILTDRIKCCGTLKICQIEKENSRTNVSKLKDDAFTAHQEQRSSERPYMESEILRRIGLNLVAAVMTQQRDSRVRRMS